MIEIEHYVWWCCFSAQSNNKWTSYLSSYGMTKVSGWWMICQSCSCPFFCFFLSLVLSILSIFFFFLSFSRLLSLVLYKFFFFFFFNRSVDRQGIFFLFRSFIRISTNIEIVHIWRHVSICCEKMLSTIKCRFEFSFLLSDWNVLINAIWEHCFDWS